MKHLSAMAIMLGLALAGGPAFAQQATTDPHHPGGAQPPAAAQTPQPAQPGQPGAGMGMMGGGMMGSQGMMGMMGGGQGMMGGGQGMMGGMPMMQGGMMGGQGMMGMMHGGGQGAMAMGPGRHVEGRLAFLRAEIGITAAQTPQWNAFADAVRKANKDMMAAMPMMQQPQDGKTDWPTALERREKAMTAHLEGVRSVRAAVGPLYAAFSDAQKKTADELMAGPMGPMHGPMGGPPWAR
jgi:hypothetical protein